MAILESSRHVPFLHQSASVPIPTTFTSAVFGLMLRDLGFRRRSFPNPLHRSRDMMDVTTLPSPKQTPTSGAFWRACISHPMGQDLTKTMTDDEADAYVLHFFPEHEIRMSTVQGRTRKNHRVLVVDLVRKNADTSQYQAPQALTFTLKGPEGLLLSLRDQML